MASLPDALAKLDAEEDRLRAKANTLLTLIHLNASPKFAARVEKYLRDNDMLPKPEKQN